MSRQENDEDGSVGGGSFDGFTQCEALVNQPAWTRLRNSPQRSRFGFARGDLSGAILCWQHERVVESGGELPLTGDRLLVVDWRWSEDGRRGDLGTRVLGNVVDLGRRKRDQPPPGWEPVTEEQSRKAAEVLETLLGRQRYPYRDRE